MNYSVYGLIDPRNNSIFYVGYSYQPKRRFKDHGLDPAIPSYHTCKAIRAAGLKTVLCIFAEFEDIIEAKKLEREIILSFPNELVNCKTKGFLSLLVYPRDAA